MVLALGGSDRVTLAGMQANPGMGVQSVQLADGTVWLAEHVLSLLPSAVSLADLAANQAVPIGDGGALRPFAALAVADSNPHQQEETATVTLSGTGRTPLSDLGTGRLSPDRLIYTATGSAAAVQADLHGLAFTSGGAARRRSVSPRVTPRGQRERQHHRRAPSAGRLVHRDADDFSLRRDRGQRSRGDGRAGRVRLPRHCVRSRGGQRLRPGAGCHPVEPGAIRRPRCRAG